MRAIPRHFGPAGRELFGWHHPAGGGVRRHTAVVLCPPLAYEHICAYRSLRILAEQLAGAGFDALRFDYLGCGDSAGGPEDAEQVAGWLASISLAVEEARSRSGADSVVLVGLRLGATLAAHAAATIAGVAELVLWDPPPTGKAYVREMRALAQLGHVNDAPVGEDLSVAGFLLTGATAAALSSLDTAGLAGPPAPRALLIERDDRPADGRFPDRLRAVGCAVEIERLPGTSDCLVEPMTSVVPAGILDRIVAWLGAAHPGAPGTPADRPAAVLPVVNGLLEAPVFFGAKQRLFGILTSPRTPDRKLPAVIALNTGCEYHVGPHRMYVPLARRWSARGQYVFRFDLGGIGDSLAPDGAAPNLAYPAHALQDVASAIAEVRARTGAERIVLVGVCAGAWHAFEAARGDLGIDGFVSINPPLYLREGPEYRKAELRDAREARRYARSLWNAEKWKKALTGRASGWTFARLTARSLWRTVERRAGGRGEREDLEAELGRIAARGIRALFVFSTKDLSHTYYALNAGEAGSDPHARIETAVVDEADHTFRPLGAQEVLRRHLDAFLEHRPETADSPSVRRRAAS